MRLKSLSTRLILSSAAVAIVLLVVAAVLLAALFQAALERNFDARLRAVLDSLLANVEVDPTGAPVLGGELADPRFTLPLSGWYWQVKPVGGGPGAGDLASESLLEKRLASDASVLSERDKDGIATFYSFDSNGAQLRGMEQVFKFPDSKAEFSFLVAGNFDELSGEISTFRRILFSVLALLGAGLIGAIIFQVSFGLRPLRELQARLSAIREGKAERMEGGYPIEIQPVADELNLLIQSNTEVVDRARTQVGNLAHALKTPLSVITNEARDVARAGTHDGGPFAAKVAEQSELMRVQINHYLERARAAARIGVIGGATEVAPVVAALARALTRIYDNKREGEPIRLVVDCPAGLRFQGERQDLEEMVGNLMDNACKWAKSEVAVGILAHGEGAGARVHITVDDDGPGLSAEERAEVGQRGKRLDETVPGTGLGLSIVADLAGLYRGKLELDRAPTGGLRAMLDLPAI